MATLVILSLVWFSLGFYDMVCGDYLDVLPCKFLGLIAQKLTKLWQFP